MPGHNQAQDENARPMSAADITARRSAQIYNYGAQWAVQPSPLRVLAMTGAIERERCIDEIEHALWDLPRGTSPGELEELRAYIETNGGRPSVPGWIAPTEERCILDLLRRGAGVTQILQEVGKPEDTVLERLARASRLRCVLESLPTNPHAPQLTPRRFTRTLAYLEHLTRLLKAEVGWAHDSQSRRPVTIDSYGVEVQVQDGVPSFTMVGVRDGTQHLIGEDLRKRLGALWPLRRITVVIPNGWAPNDLTLMALAHAIHVDHTY